jgi:predicted permease
MRFEHWVYTVPLRLRSLFRRRQVERELDEELRYHVERQIEEHVMNGMSPEAARTAALRAIGGVEKQKEDCRDMRRVNHIENLIQDLRYAGRVLRRSPGFTAVAILSLTLGVGANTAVFQLLNAIRLRSLPVARPQELAEVRIAGGHQGIGVNPGFNTQITNPLWEKIRERQEAFSGIFAWGDGSFAVGRGAELRRIPGLWISGDLFPTLGARPALGRLFTPEDDRRGGGVDTAVISYSYWQSNFGGDDSAVGKTLIIWDKPFRVIGVTPPEFFGLEVGKGFDVALPLGALDNWGKALDRRDLWMLVVMGRLKPGWTTERAAAHLNTISPGLFEATVPPGYDTSHNEAYLRFRLTAGPAGQGVSSLRETYETSLWLLLGITGLVLLIACANLANLMLARASAREREIAVRVAIGASRGRLVRQMISESLLLAVPGAALGAGLAFLLSRSLISFLTGGDSGLRVDLSPDWRMLGFTGSIAVLTCAVFGLVPSLRASQIDPGAAMKAGGRGNTAGRERFSLQRALVVLQIAVSLTLLVGAFLFVRSFRNLTTMDAGFQQRGILFAFSDFGRLKLPANQMAPYQKKVLEQVRSIPQVESAAASTVMPLSGSSWTQGVRAQGREGELRGPAKFTYVSPEYFKTMEIPAFAGRDFNDFDTAASTRVMIVNEAFVRRFIPSGNPLGAKIRSVAEPGYPETLYEVVGLVKDTKYNNLRDAAPASVFVPLAQHPGPQSFANLVIRSSSPMPAVISAVRRRLGELSPEIEISFKVFETQIREDLVRDRLMAWLAGFFGALAAALSMIGLYGVISYMTQRRRNEIGIRLALGASRKRIVALILKETALLLLVGIGIGVAVSLAVTRGASALLFGLSPHDAPTILVSAGLLAAVACAASFLPALRAARVDPLTALRRE